MAADEAIAPVEPEPHPSGERTPPAGPKRTDEEQAYHEKNGSITAASARGSDTDSSYDARKDDHFGEATVITDAKELVTHVLHVDDDPSLSPWTFRSLLIGMPLSNNTPAPFPLFSSYHRPPGAR